MQEDASSFHVVAPLHEAVGPLHPPETSDVPRGVNEVTDHYCEALHRETEEAAIVLQQLQTAVQEDVETVPAVRIVDESVPIGDILQTAFFNTVCAHNSEIAFGANLQLGGSLDLFEKSVHTCTSSDSLPTIPSCLREGATFTESVSEQPAFEESSALPDLSELYGLCLEISKLANKEHLDHQRSSTPVHGGPDESERFIPNLDEIIVDDLADSVNGRVDQLEKSLNFKIGELIKYNKDSETRLLKKLEEAQ